MRPVSLGAAWSGEGETSEAIVSRIEILRAEQEVFDIQVEGVANFFANGILVHNCGIIDDPLASFEQAQSDTQLAKMRDWYENDFIPSVQQRGAAVIKARGASSAASAANAAIDHMRTWALGTAPGDWVSMGVYSDGSYGIREGLIYSFPCVCKEGEWQIVQGAQINDFSRAKMQATEQELSEERDAVAHLLP